MIADCLSEAGRKWPAGEGEKYMSRRTWVVVLEVATDEIRICSVPAGTRPVEAAGFRCHGPFKSKISADRAIAEKSTALRDVLYGDGRQFVAAGECRYQNEH